MIAVPRIIMGGRQHHKSGKILVTAQTVSRDLPKPFLKFRIPGESRKIQGTRHGNRGQYPQTGSRFTVCVLIAERTGIERINAVDQEIDVKFPHLSHQLRNGCFIGDRRCAAVIDRQGAQVNNFTVQQKIPSLDAELPKAEFLRIKPVQNVSLQVFE